MDVITNVAILQEKFYKKCGELYEAKEILGEKLYNIMLNDYIELYKTELKLLNNIAAIHYKQVNFVLRIKNKKLVPRNYGFLWLKQNEEKKLTKRETNVAIACEFEMRRNTLELEEQRLKEFMLPPSDNVPFAPMSEPAPSAPAPELVSKDKPTPEQEPPKATKRTRKPKAAPADVTGQPGQLQGQIGIEEINNK